MAALKNKHLITSVVLSNLFLLLFLGFGINFWLQNRTVKAEANYHYQAMQEASDQCDPVSFNSNEFCKRMAEQRLALDAKVAQSAHYNSLTRLFIAFAVFLPLITWGAYFLTRAIFY